MDRDLGRHAEFVGDRPDLCGAEVLFEVDRVGPQVDCGDFERRVTVGLERVADRTLAGGADIEGVLWNPAVDRDEVERDQHMHTRNGDVPAVNSSGRARTEAP